MSTRLVDRLYHPYLTVFEPDHKAICAAIKSTLAGENIAIPRGAESVLKLDELDGEILP